VFRETASFVSGRVLGRNDQQYRMQFVSWSRDPGTPIHLVVICVCLYGAILVCLAFMWFYWR